MSPRRRWISTPNAVKVVTDSAGRLLFLANHHFRMIATRQAPIFQKHLGFTPPKPALVFVTLPESSSSVADGSNIALPGKWDPIHVQKLPMTHRGRYEEDCRGWKKSCEQRSTGVSPAKPFPSHSLGRLPVNPPACDPELIEVTQGRISLTSIMRTRGSFSNAEQLVRFGQDKPSGCGK